MALKEEEEKSNILTTYKVYIKTTVLSIAKFFTHTMSGRESVSLKLVQMTGQQKKMFLTKIYIKKVTI